MRTNAPISNQQLIGISIFSNTLGRNMQDPSRIENLENDVVDLQGGGAEALKLHLAHRGVFNAHFAE